jgi:PST family polysaccharide transporter
VVPWLLGAEYRQAGEILTILAALPFLHAAYNIGADALTACGLQAARSLAQGAAAASMLALCLVLTPRYGASGAAIANVASHAMLATLVWGLLAWHRRSAPAVAQMRPAE